MRPREFLPRDFFALPADEDDEAIVGRGPNISLRERAARLAERRLRLGAPVGRNRPNEPGDVAAVETLLRQTGDLGLRAGSEPTGLFSVGLDRATRRFQRRRGLSDDGIVNPDGETIRALEDESFGGEDGDARRQEAECIQNRVDLGNLEIDLDEAQAEFEAASRRVTELSEEVEAFNLRHDLQLGITVISGLVTAAGAIRGALGIIAALRAFARSMGDDTGQIVMLRREAEDMADRIKRAADGLQLRLQDLQGLQNERRRLLQKREALGCG